MADTAYNKMVALDRDYIAARKTADQICHLLRDFIPDACFIDALERVAEVAYKEGVELTTKMMRKEYEAWKTTQIEGLHILPTVPKVP